MTSSPEPPASGTSIPECAQKGLIRVIRELPKKTIVWVQGIVVKKYPGHLVVDDGSGIARVPLTDALKIRDAAFNEDDFQLGSYIMVIGRMHAKLKNFRVGINATTVRTLSSDQAPFLESLWNLEIVDSYLYQFETQMQDATG